MPDILYFDIKSGISGDMTIGALLDLGLNQQLFFSEMEKLNLMGYDLEIKKVKKNGISGTDFNVILAETSGEHHHHRSFMDIKELIGNSALSDNVKKLSLDIFQKVAVAEAIVHNTSVDEVHFHEVGAIDSIIDIVGCSVLIEMLNIDHIYSSSLPLGTGFVTTAHGNIPIPAPATIRILKGIPVYSTGIHSELVTPTGAAIIATLAEDFIDLPKVRIKNIGYGAGKKDLSVTNMLRVYIAQKSFIQRSLPELQPEENSVLFRD